MIPKASVAVNAACFALLAWLYGGDIYDVVRARSSEVSALSSLPSVPFAAALLALAITGGALTVFGVMKKRDGAWRGYRVMPIVAVVGLFVDVFVMSADKTPFSSSARAAAAIELFEQKASQLASPSAVSAEVAALEAIVSEVGDPPWLVKGEQLAKWTLKVESGCSGPRLEAAGAPAGTLYYCVAADRTQAWITAIGLPREERFGAPQLFATGGQPVVGVVGRRVPEGAAEGGQAPPTPELLPMYFDADAGNVQPAP